MSRFSLFNRGRITYSTNDIKPMNESSINRPLGTLTITRSSEDNTTPVAVNSKGNPVDLTKLPLGIYRLKYDMHSPDSDSQKGKSDKSDKGNQSSLSSDTQSNTDNSQHQDKLSQSNSQANTDSSKSSGQLGPDNMYEEANSGRDSSIPDFSKAPESGKINDNQANDQEDQLRDGANKTNQRSSHNIHNPDSKPPLSQVDKDQMRQSYLQSLGDEATSKPPAVWSDLLKQFLKKAASSSSPKKEHKPSISRRMPGAIQSLSKGTQPRLNRFVFAFDKSGSMDASKWKSIFNFLKVTKIPAYEYYFIYWADAYYRLPTKRQSVSTSQAVNRAIEGFAEASGKVGGGTDIVQAFLEFSNHRSQSNGIRPQLTLGNIDVLLIFTDGEFSLNAENLKFIKDLLKQNVHKVGYILTHDAQLQTINQFDPTALKVNNKNEIIPGSRVIKLPAPKVDFSN